MLLSLVILYMIYFCAIYFMAEIFEVFFYLVEIFWQLLWQFLKLLFQVIGEFCDLARSGIFAAWYRGWPLLKLSGRAALRHGNKLARGTWAMLVFLYYLANEALHGEEEEDYEDAETEDESDEEQAQNNSYEKALRLLGLQAGYTQESFKRAFKITMMQAHPDRGGTHAQAVAVGEARDIIKIQNNWR